MKKLMRQTLAALALLCCTLALTAQPGAGLSPEQVRTIETIVTEEMSRESIPGLSAAVAADGKLQWTNGYGYSDLENSVPAKASTVYRLASISKALTAVAALQLAAAGKLDLDAPVQKYVPTFPEKPWPITSRQLLGHIGGIRHYRGREFASTRHYTDLIEPLRIFQNDDLVAEPGTRYSYSTYGFVLLGAVVEAASGERFVDYCRRRIFAPAGMKTIADDDVFRIIRNRTRGYQKTKQGEVLNCDLADTSNKIPGGGFISAPADLVQFALAVEQARLLPAALVKQMWTPQTLQNGERTRYGLGWFVEDWNGLRVVGHGGGQQGTATILALSPEKGVVVAVMANLERSGVRQIARRILSVLVASSEY